MSLEDKAFDIGTWTADRIQKTGNSVTELSPKKAEKILHCSQFKELCEEIYDHFNKIYDQTNDPKKHFERLELLHKAIIGDRISIKVMKDEIAEILSLNNWSRTDFPQCYRDLPEAVFHEVYGFGPLKKWWDMPRSQSALVLNDQIFYDGVLQEEKFSSVERVKELIRSLTLKDPNKRINEYQPDLEVDMQDGTRVSISIPPRSQEYQITFRKFIIDEFTFNKLVDLNTIPEESLPIFQAVAEGMPRTLIVGPVRSGKSHTLKTIVNERHEKCEYIAVSMEKHPELALRKMRSHSPILEKAASEDELDEVFPTVLRNDPDYIIIGEIRSSEAEAAMQANERGTLGFLGSYHVTYTHNIPGSIARLITDRFPNRSYEAEVMRVAENIDLVIVQKQLKDKSKKRITSVTELRLDPYTLEVSTHEIMRYDYKTDSWTYCCDFSDMLIENMMIYAPEATEIMISTLKKLEMEKPIVSNNRVIRKNILLK